MKSCGICKNALPVEFFYRKNKLWSTCTPCANKRGKHQHEIPAGLPASTKALKKCTQCSKCVVEDCFVRRGRTWKTCNACSEKWCSSLEREPPDICSACVVERPPEEYIRRNKYWAICNKCAKRKRLAQRVKSTKQKHDDTPDNPPEVLPDGPSAPDT